VNAAFRRKWRDRDLGIPIHGGTWRDRGLAVRIRSIRAAAAPRIIEFDKRLKQMRHIMSDPESTLDRWRAVEEDHGCLSRPEKRNRNADLQVGVGATTESRPQNAGLKTGVP
jgi:hypothetical protein